MVTSRRPVPFALAIDCGDVLPDPVPVHVIDALDCVAVDNVQQVASNMRSPDAAC